MAYFQARAPLEYLIKRAPNGLMPSLNSSYKGGALKISGCRGFKGKMNGFLTEFEPI